MISVGLILDKWPVWLLRSWASSTLSTCYHSALMPLHTDDCQEVWPAFIHFASLILCRFPRTMRQKKVLYTKWKWWNIVQISTVLRLEPNSFRNQWRKSLLTINLGRWGRTGNPWTWNNTDVFLCVFCIFFIFLRVDISISKKLWTYDDSKDVVIW